MVLQNIVNGDTPSGTEWMNNWIELFNIVGLNTIRMLQDRSLDFSFGLLDGWGDAYIDISGRENSVDSTSYPSFNEVNLTHQTLSDGSDTPVVDAHGFTITTNTSSGGSHGFRISPNSDCVITKVTKVSSCTATTCDITNTSGSVNFGTTTFSGDDATFNIKLIAGANYDINIGSGGASYTRYQVSGASYPVVDTNITWEGDHSGSTGAGDGYNVLNITTATGDAEDTTVTHNIPSGTFGTTISSAFGVPMIDDWETGNSIQYKLTNSGGDDSGWLDYNEVSTFTIFSNGEPDELLVKLVAKVSSPTDSFPNIKGFFVRAA